MSLKLSIIKWCLLVVGMEMLAVIALSRPDFAISVIAKESVRIEEVMGAKALDTIDEQSAAIYMSAIIDSGLYATVWHTFIPTEREAERSAMIKFFNKMSFWLQDRINVFFILLFLLTERLCLMWMWTPSALVILGASMLTGFYLRKIKQGNFAFASPTVHRYSIGALTVTLVAGPFLLLTPLPVSPYLFPVVFTIAALMVQAIISNIAKRI